MNRDQAEGKVNEVKGKVKQAVGDLTDDQVLHDEGTTDEVAGKTQGAIGNVRQSVGNAVENLGKALKK